MKMKVKFADKINKERKKSQELLFSESKLHKYAIMIIQSARPSTAR